MNRNALVTSVSFARTTATEGTRRSVVDINSPTFGKGISVVGTFEFPAGNPFSGSSFEGQVIVESSAISFPNLGADTGDFGYDSTERGAVEQDTVTLLLSISLSGPGSVSVDSDQGQAGASIGGVIRQDREVPASDDRSEPPHADSGPAQKVTATVGVQGGAPDTTSHSQLCGQGGSTETAATAAKKPAGVSASKFGLRLFNSPAGPREPNARERLKAELASATEEHDDKIEAAEALVERLRGTLARSIETARSDLREAGKRVSELKHPRRLHSTRRELELEPAVQSQQRALQRLNLLTSEPPQPTAWLRIALLEAEEKLISLRNNIPGKTSAQAKVS